MSDGGDLVEHIRGSIIGDDEVLEGPFGPRRVTYADYTASGRALGFIEEFIRRQVLPMYANTHTETSGTGHQTTRFREDARRIVHRMVGGSEEDVVLFCGSGATGAIHRLIQILNLQLPAELDARYRFSERIPGNERPVVFIGPYEHHSNELPWRESIADVVVIDEDPDGQISLEQLARELDRHRLRPLKIGSFSAASNVTGIESDTEAVSRLLHQHGALAFWDYAAAAPYVKIDMNRPDGADMDALFLSPHKLVGGPGTPGVLVVKRSLLKNRVPSVPGGGTVAYVNPTEHRYLTDPTLREEGGTPAIVESIRAGLVFQLKEAVGSERIEELEKGFIRRAIEVWGRSPNIYILGNRKAARLSIVSFIVRHGRGFLHHNFVVALLNDLLGIQARGGCSCAGPYGHRLLGIDLTTSREFECEISKGHEGIKPGWVRINFNYFISETVFDFLLRGVRLVAEHGWRLLPQYTLDLESGVWRHQSSGAKAPRSLEMVSYKGGTMRFPAEHARAPESVLATYLEEAERILEDAGESAPRREPAAERLPGEVEELRWFPLPSEVWAELHGRASEPPASGLLALPKTQE